eukprot:355943-Chlamydomonas_euryale.AAC.14
MSGRSRVGCYPFGSRRDRSGACAGPSEWGCGRCGRGWRQGDGGTRDGREWRTGDGRERVARDAGLKCLGPQVWTQNVLRRRS